MAIAMRLNTRRRTAVAMAPRLPRYARNDKVGRDESVRPFGGLGVILRQAQDERELVGDHLAGLGWAGRVGLPALVASCYISVNQ